MSLSISSALATAALAADNYAPGASSAQRAQPTPNNSADTVILTEAQQVYQLYKQGQHASQIAFNLDLPLQAVNSYLRGIAGSSS